MHHSKYNVDRIYKCVALSFGVTVWLIAACHEPGLAIVGLLVAACFAAAHCLPLRILKACIAITLLLASTPWCGVGIGSMRYPGSMRLLPALRLPDVLTIPIKCIYAIAEMPLSALAVMCDDCRLVVEYGEGCVQPFVVFVFWVAVSAVQLVVAVTRERRQRHFEPSCRAQHQ